MKLIVREYLSMLRESGELDALLPDLLFAMNITPISRPQRGVRQFGVDIAATGRDPKDGRTKLFLFIVKAGNLDRHSWNDGPQSVYSSLHEAKYVYLQSHVDKRHKHLPVKIVVCCNGEMMQEVVLNWAGYVEEESRDDREFEFWNVEEITGLILEHLLNEQLFPEEHRRDMRTTLALLESPDFNLSRFEGLIQRILFADGQRRAGDRMKALRLAHLCLRIVHHWAKELNNLKPAYEASEYVLLVVWKWLRQSSMLNNKQLLKEFVNLIGTSLSIQWDYFAKIEPYLYLRHGLFDYGTAEIDYKLLTFEQIGMVSIIALNHYWISSLRRDEKGLNAFRRIANGLEHLIANNLASCYPMYDGHVTDITLALLVLHSAERHQPAVSWIKGITQRLSLMYRFKQRFPISSDSYYDLVETELGHTNVDISLSTLIPILAEWTVVFNAEEEYHEIRSIVLSQFASTNLQLWYPDDTIEDHLYERNALHSSGTTRASIELLPTFEGQRQSVIDEAQQIGQSPLSFMEHQLWPIGLMASRHFRTPVFPTYWRHLLIENSL